MSSSAKLRFFQKCLYTPHEKQMLLHESQARFRVVAAGARGGKSMAAGAEIAWELLKPDRRIWIVSSQYELASKEMDWALAFLANAVDSTGKKLLDYGRLISATHGSRQIHFPWGSWCKTKSTEKPQTLLGEELDLLVLGEASQVTRAPWERMLRARLGSRQGRLLAISTPNADGNIFREFFENGQKGLAGEEEYKDWNSWQFSTLDNPTFSRDEWEKAKIELDEKVFQEQYEGKFVSRRGLVFNTFADTHIIKEIPKHLSESSYFVGIQRGYNNPYAVLFINIDPKTRTYYVVSEIYKTQALPGEIAKEIHAYLQGKRVVATLGDYRDQEALQSLRSHGISATVNHSEKKISKPQAVMKRLQAIQNCLKIREDVKTARLYIHESCVNLIRELKECKWPDSPAEGTDRAEIELPLTKYLQTPLALSYVIAFCEQAVGVDIYALQRTNKSLIESEHEISTLSR